jgi:glycosyltransferase involved in cell wall biosynthesis
MDFNSPVSNSSPQTCFVNLVGLNPPVNGGIARVALEICRLLLSAQTQGRVNLFFVVDESYLPHFYKWIDNPNAVIIPWQLLVRANSIMDCLRPDFIVHPLFGIEPFDAPEFNGATRHIVSMPDALALDHPEFFEEAIALHRRKLYMQLKSAAGVITLSECSRERLVHHIGLGNEVVHVVPLAGDFGAVPVMPEGVAKPFVFYPANDWPHKRHELLVRTFAEILHTRPELQLVLTGHHHSTKIRLLCAEGGVPLERVTDLGRVSDSQLAGLYQNAEAMIFTSGYEGFGMPLLEAMHFGCPVICQAVTSIPEVAGDAALYVEGDSPKDWAECFLSRLPQRRAELIARGTLQAEKFSWSSTLKSYRHALVRSGLQIDEPNEVGRKEPKYRANLEWDRYAKDAIVIDLKKACNELQKTCDEQGALIDNLEVECKDLREYYHSSLPVKIARFFSRMGRSIRKRTTGLFVKKCWMQMGVLRQHEPRKIQFEIFPKPSLPDSALPSIAVVTPSYMQGCYLERTMQSILAQEYPKLGYIVQDGGSTDGSVEIIKRYESKLAAWESAPDAGQSAAIKRGFEKSGGEIMAWLNSDDLHMPGTLRYVGEYFAKHPSVDAVYGHRVIIDDSDGEVGRWVMPRHEAEMLKWADYVPQETLFWRRSLWDKVDGVDASFRFALDWDLLIRFQKAGAKIVRLPYFLGCFRVHPKQKTSAEMVNSHGEREMARIRHSIHGRKITHFDMEPHVKRYYAKAAATAYLLSMGIRV